MIGVCVERSVEREPRSVMMVMAMEDKVLDWETV